MSRALVVLMLAIMLVTLGCAGPNPTPAPSATRPPDPFAARIRVPTFGSDVVAATQELLAREGVATVSGSSVEQGAAGPPLTALSGGTSAMTLLDDQVHAIALDAWASSGIEGSDLDSQVTVPDGAAPPSLLLAAYVDLGYTPDATPGARVAASLVGHVDGSAAASTSYPVLVMALLAADATRDAGTARAPLAQLAAFSSPCTSVTNFFDNAISAVFDAVKVKSGGFFGTLWNVVVAIGQTVVGGLIKALTAPVIDVVTKIVGFVAVVVQVVSFLRPWTLAMSVDDPITRFSVGNESSITDASRVSIDLGGLDEWPTILVDCALAAGVTLPDLKPAGAPVTWSFQQFPDDLFPVMPLVTLAPTSTLNDSLGVNGQTQLRLDTGHEEKAEGDIRFGRVRVFATVHRPGLDSLKQSLTGLIVKGLPSPIQDVLASLLSGPISAAVGQLDALTDESGNIGFGVTYHQPKEETPAPTLSPTLTPRPSITRPPGGGGGVGHTPGPPRPTPKPKGGAAPCDDGCGASEGDPHMQTLDGQEYDFQAAGEYTLLRSPDGSMEMQSRQVPYPNIPDVSINTALAWRVGAHRVGVYGTADGYTLMLDGAPVSADAGTVDLGGGAAVTALANGVEVAYPDGTIATAVAHGNGFEGALDIEVAPSDSFRTAAVGLLATLASGSELPALPDGTALPMSTDRPTRYHQRYQVLAPAWHVTDQTSLFDYEAGQSTQTFDVPGFPSGDVAFDAVELQARMGEAAVEAAAEQCAGVGGTPKIVTKCIFDILATNNPVFAQAYLLLQRFLTDGPNGLEECRPPDAPSGFAVTPCVESAGAEVLGSDGTLYAAISAGGAREVAAIDPTSGKIVRSRGFQNVGDVAFVAGSLWATSGNFVNETGTCALVRLDPATMNKQASISLACSGPVDIPQLVASSDAIWIVDGSSIRAVDTASNQLGAGVALPVPVESGKLLATGQNVYDGSLVEDGHWYVLGAGGAAFTDLGNIDGFGDSIVGGGALWIQDVDGAKRFTASGTPDATVAFDGTLAAADGNALYVGRSDRTAGHSELWRYPVDGSAPSMVAQNDVSVELFAGSENLAYADPGSSLLLAGGRAMATWLIGQGKGAVMYIQPVALP